MQMNCQTCGKSIDLIGTMFARRCEKCIRKSQPEAKAPVRGKR